jgi:Fe2+ or Zn2+ uptake regulation protein
MSHDRLNLPAVLHAAGYRMTPQRQMVLDALCAADGHATPEQVYERVRGRAPAVNRATVYRALRFWQDLGIVTATSLPDGHLEYEIAGTRPHHHLVCEVCGADLEIADEAFAGLAAELQARHGFQVAATHLTLRGRCAACG